MVERRQRGLEAAALGPDQAVGRDRAVVEVQLAGRGALDAELVLGGADRESLIAIFDHERRDAVAPTPGSVTAMTV